MKTELKRLVLRNFLSIGGEKVFNFYKNKVVLFRGDIGSGKSTIIDGLSVALFGKTYSGKSISDIINWTNNKKCYVSIEFSYDGADYIVERYYKPDKHSFTKILPDGAKEDVDYTGKDGLNKEILSLLGIDRKIFDQTVFISSRFSEPFLELKMQDKRDFIRRVFGQERYDKMLELVKDDLKNIISEYEGYASKLQLLEEQRVERDVKFQEVIKEENEKVDELKVEIDGLKRDEALHKSLITSVGVDDINKASSEKFSILSKIKECGLKTESLKKDRESNERIQKELEFLSNELNDMKYISEDILSEDERDVIVSDITNIANEGKGIDRDIDDVKEEEKSYIQYMEYFSEKKQKKDRITAENEDNKKRITALREKISGCITKEKPNGSLSELEGGISNLHFRIKTSSERIDYYKNNKVCSECGNVITGEYADNKIKQYNKEIETLTSEQNSAVAYRDILQKTLDDYYEYENLLKDLERERENLLRREESLNDIQSSIDSYKKIDKDDWNGKISELEKKRITLREDFEKKDSVLKRHKSQVEMRDAVKANQEKQEKLQSSFVKIELRDVSIDKEEGVLKDELFEKEKQILSLQEESSQNAIRREKISQVGVELRYAEKTLSEKTSWLKSPIDTVLDDIIKKSDGIKEESLELVKKIEMLEKMTVVVGDNGIKRYIISKYLPLLNTITKRYLMAIGSQHGVVFNNKKGLTAEIYYRGREIPYSSLSNGQSQRVNMGILFTFIEFLRRKNDSNFPLIFLDEMFDSSMSPDALNSALNQVKENIPYVNIISHRSENVEMADVIVDVDILSGFSEYKYREV